MVSGDYSDISLDDFISKNKIGKGGRSNNSRGGGRGGSGRGGGRGDSDRGARRDGGVSKRGGGDSGSFSRRSRDLPDKWDHDMYSGGRGGGDRGARSSTAKLSVSNLDFGVSDEDMRELFAEFGALKKSQILYDRSGRSTGQAEVEFVRLADARTAMETYNQVPLDGRPMNITLSGGNQERSYNRDRSRSPRRRGGYGGNRDGGNRRGGNRGGGANRREGGGRREKKEEVTQEQLDAEMDAYLNDRKKE